MSTYDSAMLSEIINRVMAEIGGGEAKTEDALVPVGVSNRHIHLTQEHVEILFGKGYELTPFKDLSQPGQYACKEQLPSSTTYIFCKEDTNCSCRFKSSFNSFRS